MYNKPGLVTMRWAGRFDSVPAIVLGLLVITFAMIRLPWPPDQPGHMPGTTISYLDRARGKIVGVQSADTDIKTVLWHVRRVGDALAGFLLIVSYAVLFVALTQPNDRRRAMMILMLVGVLGIVYGALVGLYPGPMTASAGFSLVLCGAGVNLAGLNTSRPAARNTLLGALPPQKWDSKSL